MPTTTGRGRVVVAVAGHHVRLDQREVRERSRGGVLLELGERHEVGRQPVLQAGIVDHAGNGGASAHHVHLPGLAVRLEPLEDRLCDVPSPATSSPGVFTDQARPVRRRQNERLITPARHLAPVVKHAGFTPDQVPVLSGIARDFGVFDHWFCEVPSQTFMNRSFWTAATSSGLVVNSPAKKWLKKNDAETIFERLEAHGKTWKVYVDGADGPVVHRHDPLSRLKDRLATHFVPFAEFERDAAAGRCRTSRSSSRTCRRATATTTRRRAGRSRPWMRHRGRPAVVDPVG